MEFEKETLDIMDYQAKHSGFLKVDVVPCESNGNEDVNLAVNDPTDLVCVYIESVFILILTYLCLII